MVACGWRFSVERRSGESRDEFAERLRELAARLREDFTTPITIQYGRVVLSVEDTWQGSSLSMEDTPEGAITGWCWTERVGVSSEEVRLAADALQAALDLGGRQYGQTYREKFQAARDEYISVALPTESIDRLDVSRLEAAIGKSASMDHHRLRFGPEQGVLKRIERFLQDQEDARRRERRASWLQPKPPEGRWFLYPLLLALALLIPWIAPLRGWAAALVLVLTALFFIAVTVGLLRRYEDPWSRRLRRGPVVASAGLAGIFVFGVVYALAALADKDALGDDPTRLGDAFLTSTTLGVAGGLIGGDLNVAARIVAHVQLLLFLGGLTAAAIALLQLMDRTERGRD